MIVWNLVQSNEKPQPYGEGVTTVYFRTKFKQLPENGWEWQETTDKITRKAQAAQDVLNDLLKDLSLEDVDLVKALLNFVDQGDLQRIYDKLLEAKLKTQKEARGYTLREPSSYADSPCPRYRQDAEDWKLHVAKTMIAGLTALNQYQQSGQIPGIDEFLAGLPNIVWTIDPECKNPSEGMIIEGF